MKILITTDWYKSSVNGVVTSVTNLEKGLRKLGHEIKILTLSQNRLSYIDGDVTYIGSLNAGIIYPCARIKIPLKSRLIKNIIDWRPDIIHSQCEFSTFSLARKISELTDAPIVHTYHTIYEEYTHYFSPSVKLGRRAAKLFTRHIAKCSDYMIAPTEKVRDILDGYNVNAPVEVIPSGLDLDVVVSHKTDYEIKSFKKSIGIDENKSVILYAGRLAEEKNINEIIEYLGNHKPENAVFLIVGDGPFKAETEKKIKECGLADMTVMTGMVDYGDIKNYYAAGDIFVSASQSETQGLTYIEALVNGLKLLCKKDKCIDNVLMDGINGYAYVNENDFRKYLDRLLGDEAFYDKESAKCLAAEQFSFESFAKKAEEVYFEALILFKIKSLNCA